MTVDEHAKLIFGQLLSIALLQANQSANPQYAAVEAYGWAATHAQEASRYYDHYFGGPTLDMRRPQHSAGAAKSRSDLRTNAAPEDPEPAHSANTGSEDMSALDEFLNQRSGNMSRLDAFLNQGDLEGAKAWMDAHQHRGV